MSLQFDRRSRHRLQPQLHYRARDSAGPIEHLPVTPNLKFVSVVYF